MSNLVMPHHHQSVFIKMGNSVSRLWEGKVTRHDQKQLLKRKKDELKWIQTVGGHNIQSPHTYSLCTHVCCKDKTCAFLGVKLRV